jgi:peptidoglycan/LPS O-acetylase OafA/YrhL
LGLIRLYLALIVMIDHLRVTMLSGTSSSPDFYIGDAELGLNAGFAVLYFYVVSGFLISYALSRKYGAHLWDYFKSRFVRIFSLYWPLYVLCLFLPGAIGAIGFWPRLSSIFLFGTDWFVSFKAYPQQDFSVFSAFLDQGWSLGAELSFYVLAPFLVRSVVGSILLFTLSLATRLALVQTHGFSPTWSLHFFPATLWLFVLGHLARHAWDRLRVPNLLGVLLLAASFYTSFNGIATQAWDNLDFYVAIFLFAGSLPGIFALSKDNRALNLVGEISYPLYLIHKGVITLVAATFPAIGTGLLALDHRLTQGGYWAGIVFLAIFTPGVMIVAWCALVLIENPTARLMRAMLAMVEEATRRLALFCTGPEAQADDAISS